MNYLNDYLENTIILSYVDLSKGDTFIIQY